MKNIPTIIITMILSLGVGYWLALNVGQEEAKKDSNTTWTCSMHPQIQQNEPGQCPLCGMDLTPLGEDSGDETSLEMSEESVQLANIQTTIIGGKRSSSSTKSLSLNGKIQTDERRIARQVVHIGGRVEKLFVNFTGERVTKGQKLATIYSPELVTAQRELLEAKKFVDVNPALLEATRKKLKYWKLGNETIQRIETTEKIIEKMNIYADVSGVVTKRMVSVGDYVRTGEALYEVSNLNQLWVLFDAYETDLAWIKKGNKVEFTTEALPSKTFKTSINYIDPVINPQTRVATVRGVISNSKGLLKPEMFVKGTLNTPIRRSVNVSVPKTAVLWTGIRSVVYVKANDTEMPTFEFREVVLGESIGDSYIIKEGLEANEEVVTNGAFSIDAAAQLNNKASMMNRNVSVKNRVKKVEILDYKDGTPKAFKEQLNGVAVAYLALKDAFVETNTASATKAAKDVLASFKKVDMSLVKDDAHLYWMKQLKGMKSHTESIVKETDVEKQRNQFKYLSDLLIATVKAFGVEGSVLYVQHCPMANDNDGADWLSSEEKVLNPYFGDEMLTCGKVIEQL